MASLVLKMSMSLDGFVDSADGSSDWITAGRSPDSGAWLIDTLSRAKVHLLGAATYTTLAGYWPHADGPVARAMNEIPKIVFSGSPTTADWRETTVVDGDLSTEVTRLKAEHPDGYLLAQGGVRFARSLVEAGLVDEFRLVVHPVVLGAGEPLFTTPLALEPVRTTAFSGGAVVHVFRTRS